MRSKNLILLLLLKPPKKKRAANQQIQEIYLKNVLWVDLKRRIRRLLLIWERGKIGESIKFQLRQQRALEANSKSLCET